MTQKNRALGTCGHRRRWGGWGEEQEEEEDDDEEEEEDEDQDEDQDEDEEDGESHMVAAAFQKIALPCEEQKVCSCCGRWVHMCGLRASLSRFVGFCTAPKFRISR